MNAVYDYITAHFAETLTAIMLIPVAFMVLWKFFIKAVNGK